MSENVLPLPDTDKPKPLQVGAKDGFVVFGIDGKPIAKFTPRQAVGLAMLLVKHAIEICDPANVVTEAADKISKEQN